MKNKEYSFGLAFLFIFWILVPVRLPFPRLLTRGVIIPQLSPRSSQTAHSLNCSLSSWEIMHYCISYAPHSLGCNPVTIH